MYHLQELNYLYVIAAQLVWLFGNPLVVKSSIVPSSGNYLMPTGIPTVFQPKPKTKKDIP